ncbi:MAG: protoheme IX farnesyltransferase [Anaerolineales bacterium]|nr:protoheme IX farnesyltransferase [Anaerolineales bacterium]
MTLRAAPPVTGRFRWLSLAAAVVAFLMLLLSGVAASPSSASLSGSVCVGQWPLCNGAWAFTAPTMGWADIAARGAALALWPLVFGLAAAAYQGYRRVRWVYWPVTVALALLALRMLIGGVDPSGLAPSGVGRVALVATLAALHGAAGLGLLAALITAGIVAVGLERNPRLGDSLLHFDLVSQLAGQALLALFVLLIAGAVVTATDARTACVQWPMCGPEAPDQLIGWLAFGHRLAAITAGVMLAGAILVAWRMRSTHVPLLIAAGLAGSFFVGQAFIGAANVLTGFPLQLASLHSATATISWAATVAFTVFSLQAVRLTPLAAPFPALRRETLQAVPVAVRVALGAYLQLTKPIVMLLLLVTTAAAMVMAVNYAPPFSSAPLYTISQWPTFELFAWTMFGGALASGGASALNQVIDIDRDRAMSRTSRRPLARGTVTVAQALAFGLILNVLSFYTLTVFVNSTAAIWAMVGSIYYVGFYSIGLKMNTPQNIVIGGGAGAIPPLVGWAAVTGGLEAPAWFLFAIIFFWTPPHFWALALLKKNDYARAGVPMLPVVAGEAETRRQIVLFTVLLVALSLLLTPARAAGLVYFVSAAVLGLGFLALALRLYRTPSNKLAHQLYKYSSYYLLLVFAALVADSLYRIMI